MVEHDFYKLMQIPLYADFTEVKKRYYELALLYHPDKNPKNKHAEEYFKILTQGYNLLGDIDKKVIYDEMLRLFYRQKTKNRRNNRTAKDLSERLFQNRERKRKDIIADYLEADTILSHKRRFILTILICLSGFMLTFNHWYINYLKYDMVYNFVGFLICYTGCYLIANNIYRRDVYQNAIHIKNNNADKRAIRIFVVLFAILPVFFWLLVTTSAKLQLNYFSDYTTVQSISPQYDDVFYEYTVDHVKIKRISNIKIDETIFKFRQVRVKYSRLNPNISELVLLE